MPERLGEADFLATSINKIILMRSQIQALASTLQSVLTVLEENGVLASEEENHKMKATGSAEVSRGEPNV